MQRFQLPYQYIIVKKYLHKCINSILNQSLEDIEILCVDDCSTDFSYDLLKSYAQKDERIKLFYNENNMGLLKLYKSFQK